MFQKKIKCLIIVIYKLYKKKIKLFLIPVIKKEKELCVEIHYSNKKIVSINHTFFQISKQKLIKIFQLKRKAFFMKAIISKSEKDTKYLLLDLYVKAD